MPPRKALIPRGAFASHSRSLQQRRFASDVPIPRQETALWRRLSDPNTRIGQSITGGMEWQTSAYYWNKANERTLPVAATNVQKLIEYYSTIRSVNIRGKDTRAARTAIAARRRTAERLYVSKPRIKDFGNKVQVTAFVYDGKEAAVKAKAERFGQRPGSQPEPASRQQSLSDFILDPEQQKGLKGLISKIYRKPVELNLIKLRKPHLDADILSAVVAQQLKDRRNTPRRVIRDATWRAPLPKAQTVSEVLQAKHQRLPEQFHWSAFTMANTSSTNSSTILNKVALSQVSSVEVEAAGRLTKRLTANRSQRKMARHGATAKGEGPIVRGFRKAHVQYGFSGGKRRVGQFGIRVALGHA
ncbi:Hypothetical predicted protein [Lecanosticta acicola]|uniref:Small ribosomal subunit protein uS3m n=1 Tax=Lecanosticta acicola TaxID=111012 RepID=A0AAI8Z6G8_9PEZI|nr:Hypothetical predicted protein [Lecanosticta acicola]